MKKTKVVVALSGGVDSSVAAYLLKEQGYDLIGLFMKNWHDESVTISDECPWLEDSNDAMLVAEKLNIPFQVVDLSKDYKEKIIDYMFEEYSKGNTPNPDILCNREIKFDVFMDIALSLGADYVATGHYSRIKINNISKAINKKSNKQPEFVIILGNFYSLESAKLLKKRVKNDSELLRNRKITILKKNKHNFEVFLGPYNTINTMKNDYIALKQINFDEVDIKTYE